MQWTSLLPTASSRSRSLWEYQSRTRSLSTWRHSVWASFFIFVAAVLPFVPTMIPNNLEMFSARHHILLKTSIHKYNGIILKASQHHTDALILGLLIWRREHKSKSERLQAGLWYLLIASIVVAAVVVKGLEHASCIVTSSEGRRRGRTQEQKYHVGSLDYVFSSMINQGLWNISHVHQLMNQWAEKQFFFRAWQNFQKRRSRLGMYLISCSEHILKKKNWNNWWKSWKLCCCWGLKLPALIWCRASWHYRIRRREYSCPATGFWRWQSQQFLLGTWLPSWQWRNWDSQ